jgi:small-conductance mechanosensitive channel
MTHELNCAVYKAFAKEEITIPFPQRDLHVRTMPQS